MDRLITSIFFIFLSIYGIQTELLNKRYYPRYHLAPPSGWMNDPNGFCFFQGEYHLFYQYSPTSSQAPDLIHWGHAKSPDLYHWEHLDIGLYPDQPYDKNGVFSGSAVVVDNVMHILYTGHVTHPGETPAYEEHQNLATSKDGKIIEKYENNPVLKGDEHQPDIRDPKVWKHEDTYYMVLGNGFKKDNVDLGRILLYSSEDLITWVERSTLHESDGSLGYMFECPDFFELNGVFVLLFSPQGVKPDGDKYKNLFQTGYIVGTFSYTTYKFEPLTEFRELDHGHDFYATQTIEDNVGNRILVAWFDMWETKYAEKNDGFSGQVTLPRVLSLTSDYHVIQKPIKQTAFIRDRILYSGPSSGGSGVDLPGNTGEIGISASISDFQFLISSGSSNAVVIAFDSVAKTVSLDRGGEDGVRRTTWEPKGRLNMRIFIDASSVEVFCGEGEVTFSSRFFPSGTVKVRVGDNSHAEIMTVRTLQQTIDI